MKKILIFAFVLIALAGCNKDQAPGTDGPNASSITFTTGRKTGEQITLGFAKEEFPNVEITGALEVGYSTDGDYISSVYVLENQDVTIKGTLTYLDCHGNAIRSLDLVGQTRLETLACHDNPIVGEEITALIESLPNRTSTNRGVLLVKGRSEARKVTKEDIALATSRNWQVMDSDGNQAVAIPDMSNVQPQNLGSVANCYMISKGGVYSFKPSMGKVDEWLFEDIASAEVLWESYGTDEVITGGNLISHVSYENGRIIFVTAETFKEGNAVIAAKDADGNMLWCWHIWMTDQPKNVKVIDHFKDIWHTVMDRNVGATGADLSDNNIFGLYYYYRSNHPFIGPASLQNSNLAKGTVEWAEFYKENPSYGSDAAEYYNLRSVDPCPAGWRVMSYGAVAWLYAWGVGGAREGGFDLDTPGHDYVDDYCQERLIFPYGGIRNDDGSYSYVNTRSLMIVYDDSRHVPMRWGWYIYPGPGTSSDAYGYVRCMKE